MKKKLICLLLALILCLPAACLAETAEPEPVLAFLLESLKEGEVCPGVPLGAAYEAVVQAGVPLATEPETENDFDGKISRTFKVQAESGEMTLNETALREIGFQFLDDALLNVSFYCLPDALAQPFIEQLDGLFGEHEARDTAVEGRRILTWTFQVGEQAEQTIRLSLVQITEGETVYASSIQATAQDLLPTRD